MGTQRNSRLRPGDRRRLAAALAAAVLAVAAITMASRPAPAPPATAQTVQPMTQDQPHGRECVACCRAKGLEGKEFAICVSQCNRGVGVCLGPFGAN